MLPIVYIVLAAMFGAACSGSDKAARQKLADLRKDYTTTDFFLAAENGDQIAVSLFLDAGMSADTRGEKGETVLMRAATADQTEIVRLLLRRKADHSLQSNRKLTALMAAASVGRLGPVKALCEAGAALESKSVTGGTALYYAAMTGNKEVVAYLISKGADSMARDTEGNTALIVAIQNENYSVIESLLSQKSPLNLPNQAGFTAYDYAIRQAVAGRTGAKNAARNLLASGATAFTSRFFNLRKVALADAISSMARPFAEKLTAGTWSSEEPFSAVVSAYASEFETNSFPISQVPFMYFSGYHALGKARFAFEIGHDGFASDSERKAGDALRGAQSALLEKYRSSLAKAIAGPEFDPNAIDPDYGTALMISASTGDLESAKALLAKGADPSISMNGETALAAAEHAGQTEMILLLGGNVKSEKTLPPQMARESTKSQEIAKAKEEVQRAKLMLGHSENNYKRSQELFESNLISKESLESSKTEFELAKNVLGRAERELGLIDKR
jgi:ankyrin repeat protein